VIIFTRGGTIMPLQVLHGYGLPQLLAGEAMNEVPLGFDWPKPSARLTRTVEALKIIRKLWGMPETPTNSRAENKEESGFVDFNVEYFLIQQAKLYTAPTYAYISSSGWTRVNSSSRQIL
jgi:hypothetical protein